MLDVFKASSSILDFVECSLFLVPVSSVVLSHNRVCVVGSCLEEVVGSWTGGWTPPVRRQPAGISELSYRHTPCMVGSEIN